MPLAGAPGYVRFLAELLISHDVTVNDSETFEITLQGCPDQTVVVSFVARLFSDVALSTGC